MSNNIKSYFEVRPWVPEAINSKEENDLIIQYLLQSLKEQPPGQNAVSVGGDTLVFAAVEANGDIEVYECTIRRASANLVLEHPVMPKDGSVN